MQNSTVTSNSMLAGQEWKGRQEWDDTSTKKDQISYPITLNTVHLFLEKKFFHPSDSLETQF